MSTAQTPELSGMPPEFFLLAENGDDLSDSDE